jgi:hypothetical protein
MKPPSCGLGLILLALLLSACVSGARVISGFGFGDRYDGEGKYRSDAAGGQSLRGPEIAPPLHSPWTLSGPRSPP